MDKQELIEITVDNYINDSLLQEGKLKSFHPKLLKSYTDEVIQNSFETVIEGIKTILKGGVIGGTVGILVNIGKAIAKTTEQAKRITAWDKFKKWLGLSKEPEVSNYFTEFFGNLKDRFQEGGTEMIIAGIFTGLTLALIHAVFIKRYNMPDKKAKQETLKMAKKASIKADKNTKKVIDETIDEYQKFGK